MTTVNFFAKSEFFDYKVFGALGPRNPGAQGPRDPGAQGPWGTGTLGPRDPGALGLIPPPRKASPPLPTALARQVHSFASLRVAALRTQELDAHTPRGGGFYVHSVVHMSPRRRNMYLLKDFYISASPMF